MASGGIAGYLFIAALLVASVRCFRGRALVDGVREAMGALMLLVSVSVLLYLPFADSDIREHGPGGLLGEWLGELAAGFIGSVGAALAATTGMVIALLMVTEISTREVAVVLAWAGRHAGAWHRRRCARRVAGGTRGVPREGRQRRGAAPRASADEPESDGRRRRRGDRDRRAGARRRPDCRGRRRRSRAVPAPVEPEESEGVRVGEARTVSESADPERAAMAAIVAEIAAVERVAAAARRGRRRDDAESDDDEAAVVTPPPPPPPAEAPIIVEPAYIARMRQQKEDAAARADAAAEAKAEAEERPASSSWAKARSSSPAPTCWSTSRPPNTRPTSSRCTTWPSAWSRRCRTTACAAR